jgi:hypothetical protein
MLAGIGLQLVSLVYYAHIAGIDNYFSTMGA